MITALLVEKVRQVEQTIKELNRAMRHLSSPESVAVLRRVRNELDLIYDQIMNSCIVSNTDIEHLLTKHRECIRECIRPVWQAEPINLPYPTPYVPPAPPAPPVVSVAGVNLIIYADATGSMTDDWRGSLGNKFVEFATYLNNEAVKAGIPCKVSLIWFGDKNGQLTSVGLNKGSSSDLARAFRAAPVLHAGNEIPESGMLAIYKTLKNYVDPSVANTLIYVTDALSKTNEGASAAAVKALFDQHDITAFAIHPKNDTGINIFDATQPWGSNYNLKPWADKTLNP